MVEHIDITLIEIVSFGVGVALSLMATGFVIYWSGIIVAWLARSVYSTTRSGVFVNPIKPPTTPPPKDMKH